MVNIGSPDEAFKNHNLAGGRSWAWEDLEFIIASHVGFIRMP
jgi:hypothetical protein